jgi:hypothetical protein
MSPSLLANSLRLCRNRFFDSTCPKKYVWGTTPGEHLDAHCAAAPASFFNLYEKLYE